MDAGAWLLGVALGLGPAAPSPTEAPADPPSEAEARPQVEIALVGASDARGATREVLDELLRHLEVDVAWNELDEVALERVLRPAEVDDTRIAHVHVVLVDDENAMIYVADRDYARILVRPVPLPAGFDEIAREEVGAIVSSAVEALLEGAEIGISRQEAEVEAGLEPEPEPEPEPDPEPEPEPKAEPPPARAQTRPWLGIGVGYGFDIWRPEMIAHGPNMRLELGARGERVRIGAAIGAGYLVPQTVGASVLPTLLTGANLRAGVTARGALARHVEFFGVAALGSDLLWTRGEGGDTQWSPIPMAEFGAGPGFTFGRGLRVDLEVSLGIDLVDTRILTTDDIVVLDPSRVRPGARVRFAWDAFAPREKSSEAR